MSAETQADECSSGVISAGSEPEPEPAEAENGDGSQAAAAWPVPPRSAGGKYGPVMRRRLKKFLAIVEEEEGWECVTRVSLASCIACILSPAAACYQRSGRACIQCAKWAGCKAETLGPS